MLSIIVPFLKKAVREKSAGALFSTFQNQKRTLELSYASLLDYSKKWLQEKWAQRTWTDTLLSDDFKQEFPLRKERSTYQLTKKMAEEHGVPVSQIVNLTNVICNEQLNHIGAYYGHQYSFPFFDREVIELGLATPLKIRFDQGRGRGLIRHGLQSLLPQEVASRLTKTNFVEYSNVSAKQLYAITSEMLHASTNPVWTIIDQKKLRKVVDFVHSPKVPIAKKMRYNWLLSRAIYASIWFDSIPLTKK